MQFTKVSRLRKFVVLQYFNRHTLVLTNKKLTHTYGQPLSQTSMPVDRPDLKHETSVVENKPGKNGSWGGDANNGGRKREEFDQTNMSHWWCDPPTIAKTLQGSLYTQTPTHAQTPNKHPLCTNTHTCTNTHSWTHDAGVNWSHTNRQLNQQDKQKVLLTTKRIKQIDNWSWSLRGWGSVWAVFLNQQIAGRI